MHCVITASSKWFDNEFSKDATDEATAERLKKAKNKRESALKKLRRKEPKLKKRAPKVNWALSAAGKPLGKACCPGAVLGL